MSLQTDPGHDTDDGPPGTNVEETVATGLDMEEAPMPTQDPVEAVDRRPLTLQRALREVEANIDTELVALTDRFDGLRTTEEELQDRLEQLYLELGNVQAALTDASKEQRATLDGRRSLLRRRCELQATAVQRVLKTEAAELTERQRAWGARTEAAETRARAFQENPDLADQIAEFRQLDERMDTLELLPESYRDVVRSHHSELKARLGPHLEQPKVEPLRLLTPAIAVAITATKDDDDGGARLLAVLPVPPEAHDRARSGEADLAARFTHWVLAALSRFVVNIGARSEAESTDLGGLLGLELPFDDLGIPATAADLARAVRESFAESADERLAEVEVAPEVVFLSVETLELLWKRAEDADVDEGRTADAPRKKGRRRK